MLEWAALGAIMFAIAIFCARIMKRGLSTLDDAREKNKEHIADGRRQLEEDSKRITADEQLHIAHAALEDLLRLENKPDSGKVTQEGHILNLESERGNWRIELLMREIGLKSRHKVLHGQSRWLLQAGNETEEHQELATLMASLNRRFHGKTQADAMPAHLARRVKAGRVQARARRPHAPSKAA